MLRSKCRPMTAGFSGVLFARVSAANAGNQIQIPVNVNIQGEGIVAIGILTVDENQPPAGDGFLTADFALNPNFAFLDKWYDFRWVNVQVK